MKIEEDTPDYFEGEDLPDTIKEKKHKFRDDDPRRWLQPAGKWDHLSFIAKGKIWAWIALCIAIIAILYGMYIRYITPYAEGCVQYGYVERIERRNGKIFKSFEGVLLPYKELMDTTRIYSRDFSFSTSDPAIAAQIKKFMLANRPVMIEYKEFRTAVPWRGDSKIMVTGVDSVNPSRILPPEYLPEYAK